MKYRHLDSIGNRVYVVVDILSNISGVGFGSVDNIIRNETQSGYFLFNDDGEIYFFELSIYRLGEAVDPIDEVKPLFIQGICAISSYFCDSNPSLKNYDSFEDCVANVSLIPYGSWNKPYSRSAVCFQLHSLLVQIPDPIGAQIHCPHLSTNMSRNLACVDRSYDSFYDYVYPA